MLNILQNTAQPQESYFTWSRIRDMRNEQLKSTDWVVLPDVTVANKNAWLLYRQQLRDITNSFPSPESVVWPTPPQ